MKQNIIIVKKERHTLNRDKLGRAIVRITPEAADIVESFISKSDITVQNLVSSMITFAAPQTMIKEEGYGDE